MTLKEARDAAGLSQKKLDRLAKLPIGTTSDIELGRNRNPSWEVVAKLTAALHKRGLAGVTERQLFPLSKRDASSDAEQVPA